jgi:hypothetical protein
VFQESSSPELTELLSTIRSKRILPTLLNAAQRKLIQSSKAKAHLTNEPVYALIGDEEVRLEHINVTKDVPSEKSFLRVLDLTTEPQDWRNMPALIEGLHNVKKLAPRYQKRFILAAAEAGMVSVLLQCLQQAANNGFSLNLPVVRLNMFHIIRDIARNSDWEEEATQKCLKQIQQVLDFMDDPAHCGEKTIMPDDPRTQPYVIAIPLEIAAMRVTNHLGGVDEGGLVAMYTSRLLAALDQPINHLVLPLYLSISRLYSFFTDQYSQKNDEHWRLPETSNLSGRKADRIPIIVGTALDILLKEFLPVRNALKLAEEVLSSSLPKESLESIKSNIQLVDARLSSATQTLLELNKPILELKKMTTEKYAFPSLKEALQVLEIPLPA